MSYARWSDGDVYVYKHYLGWWQIHLTGGGDFQLPNPDACAKKLESLRQDGWEVPQYAIDALLEEAAEIDPSEPCGDLSAAPFGGGEPDRIKALPNCAVDCMALCQMSTRGYCERPASMRPHGGWSDSGPVEGQ